jgi:hypothetical protein
VKITPHVSASPRLYVFPKFIRRLYRGEMPHKTNYSASWPIHCHISYSEAFVQNSQSIKVQVTDILVSFDVVSLFTKFPLYDIIQLLSPKFNKQTVDLFRHVLTKKYFLYDGSFYY